MSRKRIGWKTKLVATLCQLVRYDETISEFVKVIPYDESKRLTEDQILSRFEFHHDPIPKAHGGKDVHYNLVPLPSAEHDKITATVTIPAVAKSKRLVRAQAEFNTRMSERLSGNPSSRPRKRKIQSRGFPKVHRPMRGKAASDARIPR